MNETQTVRCTACELRQSYRHQCRRCLKALPKPLVHTVVKHIDLSFGPTAPVMTLEETKRRAVIHALKKSSNVIEAAKRLQIGKTTLYRMMDQFGIRRKDDQAIMPAELLVSNELPPEQNYLFTEEELQCLS